MKRKLKQEYNTLESIKDFLATKTSLECFIALDEWIFDEIRVSRKCVVVKKSGIAGAKVVFEEANIVDIQPIAPSRFINTLTMRGLLAMIIQFIISGAQNKVAEEVENHLLEIQII
ncbi:hypothetical protein AAG747_25490 [Rapidithrix thailandica]|uniref:Uncharacterized protein n=1 Tax=Rapidithrix thailandica TaxID=413964 RepID=A0AAW9S514_9BACT